MWKMIGIPVVLYLIFIFYIYQPNPEKTPIAKLIEALPMDQVERYIQVHSTLAIREMQSEKIPASITLAQGILESQYGTSELAKKANNHFGIKASSNWNSKARICLYSNEWSEKKQRMLSIQSCFRKYTSVDSCFRDHSHFLTQRPYYTKLFLLDIMDYQAWAKELQRAGYATDPQYAEKLIALIDRYALTAYDKKSMEIVN